MTGTSALQSIRGRLAPLERIKAELDAHEGLSARAQLAVFVVAMLTIASHDPSHFTQAQFFAEDGTVWFAQAYNLGWLHSLFLPSVGYLSVAERLGTGIALLLPFRFAPLAMMLIGLLFQWLPVAVLLSPRCRNLAPLTARILLAALYIALPNSQEVYVVLTNCMWHLGLAVVLLVFSEPPRGWPGRCFDICALLLCSVSGPFCILLAPLLLLYWWLRRQPWSLVQLAAISIGDAMQLYMLHYHGIAHKANLGATPQLFIRLLGGNVFTGMLFGSTTFGWVMPLWLNLMVFVAGLAILLYCMRNADLGLRLFIVYGFALLSTSLMRQIRVDPLPSWVMLLAAPSSRYYFFPGLAFVWASAWCALFARSRLFRTAGVCVMLAIPVGIVIDWHYPPFDDMHFDRGAQQFEAARPGEHVVLSIPPYYPHIGSWSMELIKKPR